MSTHYVPGDGLAVVVHGTVAFLPDGGDQATVEALWQSLSAGGTMTDHLQVLLAPGLAAAPSFGLVRVSDGVAHVVVRGSATAIAATRSGERVVGAAHVSTWTEESLAEVSAVRVAGRRAGVGGPLPVSVAVVPAAEVTLDATTGAVVVVADAAAADAVMTVPVVAPPVVAPAVAPVAPTAQPAAQPALQPALPARTGSPTWTDEDAEDDVRSPAWSGPSTDPEDHELPAPVSLAEHPRDEPAAADAQDEADADEDLDGQDEAFGDAPPVLSGVPQWSPVRTPAAEPPVQQVEPEPEPARPLHHVVQHPATPTAPAGVPAMVPQRGAPEDHDGLTVLSSDVVALRRQLPEWAGDAVPQLAVPTPRTPAPAKLLMSTGLVVSLNRPVLIGRAPQVTRVTNNEVPRLITVASPNQDISRTHAEVRMDGEDVVITDLRSTNGVLLLRQGQGAQRLHPGEPTVVEPGVVVDLGEGVTFLVEAGG